MFSQNDLKDYEMDKSPKLQFHEKISGFSIAMSHDYQRALLIGDVNGYIFSSKHIPEDEVISLKLIQVDPSLNWSIAIGCTNYDPLKLKDVSFPYNPDEFLSTGEFWKIQDNVCDHANDGDIIHIVFDKNKNLCLKMDDQIEKVIMHMPKGQSYLIIELKGRIKGIEICKETMIMDEDREVRDARINKRSSVSGNDGKTNNEQNKKYKCRNCGFENEFLEIENTEIIQNPQLSLPNEELPMCVICRVKNVAVVLEPCGHAIMCKECAERYLQKDDRNPNQNFACPMCRQRLKRKFFGIRPSIHIKKFE